jgi:hypothetical protein
MPQQVQIEVRLAKTADAVVADTNVSVFEKIERRPVRQAIHLTAYGLDGAAGLVHTTVKVAMPVQFHAGSRPGFDW